MKNRFYLILFVILATLSSCSDIFETDLEKKDLTLVLPSDSIITTTYTTGFMWNKVDGASAYKFQIVSPGFDNIQNFVLDSNMLSTSFAYTLSPGTYQWRVRAQNGSSETSFQTRTIIVKSGTLAEQKVNLSSPINASVFSASSVQLSWTAIYGTTNYTLEVDTISGDFTSSMVLSKTTSGTKISFPLNEGNYKWRVRAANDTAVSKFSDERTFMIDKTAPSKITTLNYPQNTSVSKPILLTWEPSKDNLSGVKQYKVYLYKGLTNSPTDTTKVVLISGYDPLIVNAPVSGTPSATFNYTTGQANIFWRIKAVDGAGNESSFSSFNNFSTAY